MTHPLQTAHPPPNGVATSDVTEQWSAVLNVHGCNLKQIDVGVQANKHALDPHPMVRGRMVRRHPVYLVAFDYTRLDSEGRPKIGAPLESSLAELRQMYSKRYDWVSPDPPPSDGSHVRIMGRRYVAEFDQAGQPTGRVILDQGVK